jgi:hypothetical protein
MRGPPSVISDAVKKRNFLIQKYRYGKRVNNSYRSFAHYPLPPIKCNRILRGVGKLGQIIAQVLKKFQHLIGELALSRKSPVCPTDGMPFYGDFFLHQGGNKIMPGVV